MKWPLDDCRVTWPTTMALVRRERKEKEGEREKEREERKKESHSIMVTGRITDNMGLDSEDIGLSTLQILFRIHGFMGSFACNSPFCLLENDHSLYGIYFCSLMKRTQQLTFTFIRLLTLVSS